MENTIELMDGRRLVVYPKAVQPAKITPDTFALDTTGKYLSVGNRKPGKAEQDLLWRAERQYHHRLLTDNAWFLLEHKEEIFSDSRMFLAPARIINGLAYTGTSGLQNITLGIYLEWWINYCEASVDANGNLVWYVSGSPLSGSNCCLSVTPEGKRVKIAQRTPFSAIWRSLIDVNIRYTKAKQCCESYSLEEVLIKLRGEDYRYVILELKHQMIEAEICRDKNLIQKSYEWLKERYESHVNTNKRLQMELNRERIMLFTEQYINKEQNMKGIHDKYLKEYSDLKQKLKAGTIGRDYHKLRADISREYRARKRELSDFANDFMHDLLGKNPNWLRLVDILKYGRKELKKANGLNK
ncbi:MAG: hypothetical protein K2K77_05235, partial [Duncaniella sp.]|nr:hypothetical protein [Duncaniella sp.]